MTSKVEKICLSDLETWENSRLRKRKKRERRIIERKKFRIKHRGLGDEEGGRIETWKNFRNHADLR